jgi:hypothetical protein
MVMKIAIDKQYVRKCLGFAAVTVSELSFVPKYEFDPTEDIEYGIRRSKMPPPQAEG